MAAEGLTCRSNYPILTSENSSKILMISYLDRIFIPSDKSVVHLFIPRMAA
jgi:hypothetical protein